MLNHHSPMDLEYQQVPQQLRITATITGLHDVPLLVPLSGSRVLWWSWVNELVGLAEEQWFYFCMITGTYLHNRAHWFGYKSSLLSVVKPYLLSNSILSLELYSNRHEVYFKHTQCAFQFLVKIAYYHSASNSTTWHWLDHVDSSI